MKTHSIIIIFIFFLILSLSLVSAQTTQYNNIINYGENDDVTISIHTYSGFDALFSGIINFFRFQAIYITPTVPQPSQNMKLTYGGSLALSCTPTYAEFKIKQGNSVIRTVPFFNYPTEPSSWFIDVNFNAPVLEGTYLASVSFTNGYLSCYYEDQSFNVKNIVTECPAPYCSTWNLLGSTDVLRAYDRFCYTFGASPECKQSSTYQSKAVCNAGYIQVDDHSCTLKPSDTTPLPQPTQKTCYYCSGNIVATLPITTTSCASASGNGIVFYDSPPTCASTPQLKTCYYCDGSALKSTSLSDCIGIYSITPPTCSSTPPNDSLPPIAQDVVCKAYEINGEYGCKFDVGKMFTNNGISGISEDYPIYFYAGIILILIIIVAMIDIRRKK